MLFIAFVMLLKSIVAGSNPNFSIPEPLKIPLALTLMFSLAFFAISLSFNMSPLLIELKVSPGLPAAPRPVIIAFRILSVLPVASNMAFPPLMAFNNGSIVSLMPSF